ncbi:phage tail protein [Salmonella enterica subsp. enterica serovar Anatum]
MSTTYKTVITDKGAERIAAALLPDGEKLKITHFAVGDGNGSTPTPDVSQTALVHEVYRGEVSNIHIDVDDTTRIVVEGIIPASQGGFWVREIGLYDDQGELVVVGNAPEGYKPLPSEGAGRVLNCQVFVVVSNTDAIELKVVSDAFLPDATTEKRGLTILSSETNSDDETKAATSKAVKAVMDVAKGKYTAVDASTTRKGLVQLTSATNSDSEVLALSAKAGKVLATQISAKADLSSPAFTDKPTTPTAAEGDKSQQIANTEFVMRAIAALVGSSPEALDTLNELAQALGNDPNFATTVTNALAGKQPLNALLTALSGLTTSANKLPYFTGADKVALATITSTARALLQQSGVEGMQTILGINASSFRRFRGQLPTDANLDTYGPVETSVGIWSKQTSTNADVAHNFPEANAVGYIEVLPAGQFGGTQRYTVRNGNIHIRSLTGSWNGVDGPWGEWIKVGSAATTATKLATARTIGGVSFDGSANIDLPGVNKAGTQNTSGNAASATKLQTARTIGGVSFDGTANIDLPGVNKAGTQSTSGNAATATKLQTARTISGVAFDGTKNITLTAKNVGATACPTGWLITGDNNSSITTSSFITLLQNQGAFNTRAWVARCSFAAADSAYIPDSETKCGIIPLAGAVIEVVSFGMTNYTIRVTTATTSSVSGAKTNSEFIYSYDNYNGSTNSPGWRRCYNSKNYSVNLSSYVTERQLTGYDNNLDIIANTLVVKNGSNGGFAVWDISTTTSGANMYISPVSGINNVFRSTSSRRYKKDIENITDEQADKVLEMRPVWYRSTCEADNKDWGWYGLIAEEVGEIAPQYVHWRDATEEDDPAIVSSNGLVAEGVMYERLVVPLIKQVQKLTAKVEALEEELKALKK